MDPRPPSTSIARLGGARAWLALALAAAAAAAPGDLPRAYRLPDRVTVLPLFFVPRGEADPSAAQRQRLMRHVRWTQRRYRELLGGVTFELAAETPRVVRSATPLDSYLARGPAAWADWVKEILAATGHTRWSFPYVVAGVLVNSKDEYPLGAARPINGGLDRGGGLALISSRVLDRHPNFQSTLEHELGHGFGMRHVDAYGYDMKTNPSMMSYDLRHRTRGWRPATTPAVLIPEDRRALALAQRIFPGLEYDSARHGAVGPRSARIQAYAPWDVPGLPRFEPEVTTPSGETYGSRAQNVARGPIAPSAGPGVTFSAKTMWHSAPAPDRWVHLDVEFPTSVRLDGLGVHTQHSGRYHLADAVRVEARGRGEPRVVHAGPLAGPDATLTFPPTRSRRWRVSLRGKDTKGVTVRGLRFVSGGGAIFPPLLPYPHH